MNNWLPSTLSRRKSAKTQRWLSLASWRLMTDASRTAMGAVLSQRREDERQHPVAFMSSNFSPAELNYDTPGKELLAIVRSFDHWRILVEGTEQAVTVLTDFTGVNVAIDLEFHR